MTFITTSKIIIFRTGSRTFSRHRFADTLFADNSFCRQEFLRHQIYRHPFCRQFILPTRLFYDIQFIDKHSADLFCRPTTILPTILLNCRQDIFPTTILTKSAIRNSYSTATYTSAHVREVIACTGTVNEPKGKNVSQCRTKLLLLPPRPIYV